MYILDSIVLGAVQGITEFLPVSSTAHTAVCEKLFSINSFGKNFDIMLNLGTLFALLIFFRSDFLKLFFGGLDFVFGKDSKNREYFLIILLANLPIIFVFGILEFLKVEVNSTLLTSVNLVVFGVVLYWCDTKSCHQKNFSLKDGMKVGLVQLLSFFPGVSRLGICLSMCRYLGYDRRESFKFSMLLSIIPVTGACFLKLLKIFASDNLTFGFSEIFFGIFSAFVCGIITLYAVDNFLRKHTFSPIVIYRIIFGISLLSL